jgi:hypothetical protein
MEVHMKRKTRYLTLLFSLAVLILAAPVLAKGSAELITIQGPGLEEPYEITDSEVLSRFNPWAAQFIGDAGPLGTPPDVGDQTPYEVSFYFGDNKGGLDLGYVFYYYTDPNEGQGFIYLPGKDEPYYRVNNSTILRGRQDGTWYQATPAWDAAALELLQNQGVMMLNGRSPLPSALWLGGILALALLGGIIVWTRRAGGEMESADRLKTAFDSIRSFRA